VRRVIAICAAALLAAGVVGGCGSDSTTTVIETAPVTTSTSSSTDSTTSTASTSTTSTTTDGAPPPADITVSKLTGFTSPTGNIGCYIDKTTVRCDISDRDWKPPARPADCSSQVDFGQGISMDAGGSPAFVCAGDTALGGGKPLAYGQSIGAGILRCESEESGVSCTDAESGRGFTISKESYSFR
jgi:hypothetical protein